MASQMKISRKAAINMRCRYLAEEIENDLLGYTKTGNMICLYFALTSLEEVAYLKKKAVPQKGQSNGIDQGMVEAAQNADVREVIAFDRANTAHAFCHTDKRPSLYYGSRSGRAVCPVCNKTFNAIDVLMQRDGYSFIDAVKALN
jgi:hypothetical protein